MPQNTDLVTDLPADFEVFGQAVATSMADLLGGTTGQILSKTSNTDMDFTWIANDQGDITAVNTTAPLSGGATSGAVTLSVSGATTSATGVVQLSDSTSTTSSVLAATSTAVKAAYDVANGSFKPLPYVTNNYYGSPTSVAKTPSQAFGAGITYYTPIFIRESRTFNRIAIVAGSSFSGAASIRLGIYNSTAGVPSTVVLDAGLVAPIAAGTTYEITISQALTSGWYWLATNTVTAATTNTLYANTGASFPNSADLGSVSPAGNNQIAYTQTVSAAASFATAVSPTASTASNPFIALRA